MYRSLPRWAQWAIPFGVAAVVVLALVLFVDHQTNAVPSIAKVSNKNAIVEQNREASVLVRQQQAPHTAVLKSGQSPTDGLRVAVVHYMNYEIDHGVMDGPVQTSGCMSAAGGTAARVVLHCKVTASNVAYPFFGVVQPGAKAITYCQRVAPPVPSMNIPVSKRCT